MESFFATLTMAPSPAQPYFAKLVKLTRLNPAHLERMAAMLFWNEWN